MMESYIIAADATASDGFVYNTAIGSVVRTAPGTPAVVAMPSDRARRLAAAAPVKPYVVDMTWATVDRGDMTVDDAGAVNGTWL